MAVLKQTLYCWTPDLMVCVLSSPNEITLLRNKNDMLGNTWYKGSRAEYYLIV